MSRKLTRTYSKLEFKANTTDSGQDLGVTSD